MGLAFALVAATLLAGEAQPSQEAVMIVELPAGARYVGEPKHCPGETGATPEEQQICFAELYEGDARLVRYLAGARLRGTALFRLTAHAQRWQPGTRLLVVAVPFQDRGIVGNFARWWKLPERDGDFCLEKKEVGRLSGPLRRTFNAGYTRRFRASSDSKRSDFRCVRG